MYRGKPRGGATPAKKEQMASMEDGEEEGINKENNKENGMSYSRQDTYKVPNFQIFCY